MKSRKETLLEIYFVDKRRIHIRCTNHRFYNGTITELNLEKELLILNDQVIGPVPILFEEVDVIEPYKNQDKPGTVV